MGRYVNLGNAGFQSIRRDLYVDKSGLISYINQTLGMPNKLMYVSWLRRFGKSWYPFGGDQLSYKDKKT